MKTGIITTDTFLNHDTGLGHPERADRVSIIINNLKKFEKKLIWKKPNTFDKNSAQLYIDNKTYLPNELIKIKIELEEQNEELKNERILSKETVMVINETNLLIAQDGLSDNKTVYYPILLVLIFIIASVVLKLYKYLDKLDRGL